MRNRNYADYQMHERANVPFVGLVAPMSFVGEAVYTITEAIAGFVGRAFQAAMVKARERSTVKALSELDDSILKDIGVQRSEIHHLARKVAENPGVDYRMMCQ